MVLADIYAVFAYYLHHQDDVEEYMANQQVRAAEIRQKIEERWPPNGIRERLSARHSQQGPHLAQ